MNTTHLNQKRSELFQSVEKISNEKELRSFISNYPKMLDKRIQTSLDHFSLEFIEVAKVAFLGTNSDESMMMPLCINSDITTQSNTQFRLSKSLNIKASSTKDLNASLYYMAPGLGHGLRINGTIHEETDSLIFSIKAVYFHCARAAARADLWNALESPDIKEENIIQHSPFLLLKTMNAEGKTELSPRGDEAGFIKAISKKTIILPERPGNKIAVSLRNILSCPTIELLFLVPQSNKTLNVKGVAQVISDQKLLAQCAVNGKTPKTGVLIHIESSQFNTALAIDHSGIWDKQNAVEKNSITSFSKALSAHINGTGLLGKTTSAIVGAVVRHDMKNLY